MRSSKRYSNATITKRVDHDAGRHHIHRSASEPAVCKRCHAVWANRRWTRASSSDIRVPERTQGEVRSSAHPDRETVCPACRQLQEGVPGGFVHLYGAFLQKHLVEIEQLLRNEAERATDLNPLARIMSWQRDAEGGLTVSTTTDHLALRLGRAIEGAFGGDARITFSHENKLTRVRWHRD